MLKKKEMILIAVLLLAAAALLAGQRFLKKEDCGSIRITVDGEAYGTWPLSEDTVIKIKDTNVCEIKNGRVSMTEAECPDHLCIHQGSIAADGGVIVCLPNRVVIEGVPAEGQEPVVDAVM